MFIMTFMNKLIIAWKPLDVKSWKDHPCSQVLKRFMLKATLWRNFVNYERLFF